MILSETYLEQLYSLVKSSSSLAQGQAENDIERERLG